MELLTYLSTFSFHWTSTPNSFLQQRIDVSLFGVAAVLGRWGRSCIIVVGWGNGYLPGIRHLFESVEMSLKQYQNWLSHYLVSRRDGDHALAAELAGMICGFWERQGNNAEQQKWLRVQEEHHQSIT